MDETYNMDLEQEGGPLDAYLSAQSASEVARLRGALSRIRAALIVIDPSAWEGASGGVVRTIREIINEEGAPEQALERTEK